MKSSNPITGYLLHASNFMPAIVFLFYGRLGPEQPDLRWTHAFLIGGVLALAHGAWLMQRAERNSIAIGVDLFLVIGAVLALVSPTGSRLWGEALGPVAMLVCVLVVGIVHTAWSARGFVDSTSVDPERTRTLSLVLLVVTAIALAVSVAMRHSPLWGGVVPLIALVVVRGHLRRQLAQAN
ncbi:permease [Burkholderia ubonensis]|uniref:hypothetical protein n=1 Tax=Burkholderia ubonensis TaxID=101571 RepID=UPI00075D90E8|nr:hypothetical protein [Burkholderia ubonensis]KVQ96053.1 permease [Burkholderia ubonensis]